MEFPDYKVLKEMQDNHAAQLLTILLEFCWSNTVNRKRFLNAKLAMLRSGMVIHSYTLTEMIIQLIKIWDHLGHVFANSQLCQSWLVVKTTSAITLLATIAHSGFQHQRKFQ